MGKLVIKIPGNKEETFDLTSPEKHTENMERLQFLLTELQQKNALKRLKNLQGILSKDFHVTEDELHMQESK
ncbi:hypothetical protein SAMN06265339_0350 [Desulfurobacterium pacificum]|uniref:Uncharacterized protein n=1 Tax=Desulfurobacterium pacificum TaxID=240166 RepID=A0ABY1NCA4_9BACT|nr:hypothetical protein [Desulfurobacterium pacificum]SMP06192.1 hypothetical protein SAMN06265339_0350 [Desulfurobacterium pacificum]